MVCKIRGMTQDPEKREGYEVSLPVGAWKVTAWWPRGARGGPHELHIVPDGDGDPQAIARGISTGTFNAMPLVEMTAVYIDTILPAVDMLTAHMETIEAEAGKRRNRSPQFYALIAAEYVALVDAGERQPVQEIVRQTGKSGEAVRGWLRTARTMGLLTGEPGKTAGELTDKARELLSVDLKEEGE
jgi:hypothetical protein